ncbi:hypothetical protein PT7_0181 [Pusillimonas sp. T7-7]|nr:hypothetical protein PT7_0181 [Pusillimonas sp. T7-7]
MGRMQNPCGQAPEAGMPHFQTKTYDMTNHAFSYRWMGQIQIICSNSGGAIRTILATLVFGLLFAAPAWARWPSLAWTVVEQEVDMLEFVLPSRTPAGERLLMAQKHTDMLHRASIWFQLMGFPAPYQINQEREFKLTTGDRYLAFLKDDSSQISSSHNKAGRMFLASNPGFLRPVSKLDHLMEPAAVHELFHAIQRNRTYRFPDRLLPGPPECRNPPFDNNTGEGLGALDWLTEGTAAYIQIRWLEKTHGYRYGHPFKDSHRANWVRYFDQPLDWGSLPPNLRNSAAKGDSLISQYKTQGLGWWCSYGTWYFWYAMGEMLGSKQANDHRRQTYLHYIFKQPGPSGKTGLAQVDAGLKNAANIFDVISVYQGGLFNLYPLFVARYLDDDRFYEHLKNVTLASPDLYKASSAQSGGPLQPIASRAWRLRIQLPDDSADSIPYTIRIVLETPDDAHREALHLIVDRKVISPPPDPTALYSYTTQSSRRLRNEEGEIELLVRVANVARDAAETKEADFTLRVEVEGFYGEEADKSWVDQAAGELPPGFDIQGPDLFWNCTGGTKARASFTLMTPDSTATDLERMPPQMEQNIKSDFKLAESKLKELVDKGISTPLSPDELKALQSHVEDQIATAMAGQAGAIIDAGVGKLRAKNETTLSAQFSGNHGTKACQMMLRATLPGPSGGAQTLTGDQFSVSVIPTQTLRLQQLIALAPQGEDKWGLCDDENDACMTPELILEHAEPKHLAGSFRFQVVREDEHGEPIEYQTVSGYFNSTSTHTDQDSGLLNHLNRITNTVTGDIPWTNPALPGGSTFMQKNQTPKD